MRRYPHEVNPNQAHPDPGLGRQRPRQIPVVDRVVYRRRSSDHLSERVDNAIGIAVVIVVASFILAHVLVAAGVGLVCP